MTLSLALVLTYYSIVLLSNTLALKTYNLSQQGLRLWPSSTRLEIFKESLLRSQFELFRSTDASQPCSEIALNVYYAGLDLRGKEHFKSFQFRSFPSNKHPCFLNSPGLEDPEYQEFMMRYLNYSAYEVIVDEQLWTIPITFSI